MSEICPQPAVSRTCTSLIGKFNRKLKVYQRSLLEPSYDNIEPENYFEPKGTIWASVTTISGQKKFDGMNLEDTPTHKLEFRYRKNFDNSYWYEINGNLLKPLQIINVNEENKITQVIAAVTGEKAIKGNQY